MQTVVRFHEEAFSQMPLLIKKYFQTSAPSAWLQEAMTFPSSVASYADMIEKKLVGTESAETLVIQGNREKLFKMT